MSDIRNPQQFDKPQGKLLGHILTAPDDPHQNYVVLCPKCKRGAEAQGETFNTVRELRAPLGAEEVEVCHSCGKTIKALGKDYR